MYLYYFYPCLIVVNLQSKYVKPEIFTHFQNIAILTFTFAHTFQKQQFFCCCKAINGWVWVVCIRSGVQCGETWQHLCLLNSAYNLPIHLCQSLHFSGALPFWDAMSIKCTLFIKLCQDAHCYSPPLISILAQKQELWATNRSPVGCPTESGSEECCLQPFSFLV